MTKARLQELDEMAAGLLATALQLPQGHAGQSATRAESEGMSETLSLSIFTIDADRKPVPAFAAKKHHQAEAFCADEKVITKLRSVSSGGVPLCDDHSILHVRLATSDERARYHERTKNRPSTENRAVVFLVDVDKA
jgi:hypothetical protein